MIDIDDVCFWIIHGRSKVISGTGVFFHRGGYFFYGAGRMKIDFSFRKRGKIIFHTILQISQHLPGGTKRKLQVFPEIYGRQFGIFFEKCKQSKKDQGI